MKEFTRYRAIYCGLCKQIGALAGTFPRLTVAYEITFLALLLLAIREEDVVLEEEGCFLHPGRKHTIAQRDPALEYCAALSVLLGYYKLADDVADGDRPLVARMAQTGMTPGRRKVLRDYSDLDSVIRDGLADLAALERTAVTEDTPQATADVFGQLLYDALKLLPGEILPDPLLRETLAIMARDMGRWIYLTDALDDRAEDLADGSFNPFSAVTDEEAATLGEQMQQKAEETLDLSAAILPYWRDANIISNVIQLGLPRVRQQVAAGVPLDRI